MRIAALLVALLLPLGAAAQALTVSAAASLGDAMQEIARGFEAAHPGVTVRLNLAASGVLLQQIAQGAPVDVFVSADEATAARGLQQDLFDPASRRIVAANTLVLVAAVDGPASLQALSRSRGRIAIGQPELVPAGRYAQQALTAAGLWAAWQPRLVFAHQVRQVLDYVRRQEAEAGIVYRTDALSAGDRLRIVATLDGHDPVRYPALAVRDSRQPTLARDFLAYLAAPPAQAVFARLGFAAP